MFKYMKIYNFLDYFLEYFEPWSTETFNLIKT